VSGYDLTQTQERGRNYNDEESFFSQQLGLCSRVPPASGFLQEPSAVKTGTKHNIKAEWMLA